MPAATSSHTSVLSHSLSSEEALQEETKSKLDRTSHSSPLADAFYTWMANTFWLVIPDQSHLQHGSTLRDHIEVWEQLFPHSDIPRRIREGFSIDADPSECQRSLPSEVPPDQRDPVREQIAEQVSKGVCVRLAEKPRISPGVWHLKSFAIPKPGQPGKYRHCLDATPINEVTRKHHFKGEGLRELLQSVQPNDWAVVTDFKSWFWHASLDSQSQRMCRTVVDGVVYQYRSVTFGLTQAPHWLTLVLKPVFRLLRGMGVRFGGQTDDWAWLGESFLDCLTRAQLAVGLLSSLGCIFNAKGCHVPNQSFHQLGSLVNTRIGQAFLTRRRRSNIRAQGKALLVKTMRGKPVHVRDLASFVGMIEQTHLCFEMSRLMSHELVRRLASETRGSMWEKTFHLAAEETECVRWWVVNLNRLNGKLFLPSQHSLTITKDASSFAWGAVVEETGDVAMGYWDDDMFGGHSTATEVQADIEATTAFVKEYDLRDTNLLIRSDASTSVSYINRQGGRKPHLARPIILFLREMWFSRRIRIRAVHLAGIENKVADQLSRDKEAWTEMELTWETWESIDGALGPHTIDAMASSINAKLPRFISWTPEAKAEQTNFFVAEIDPREAVFLFPPDAIIARTLHRIKELALHRVTLVAPWWPAQPWFPTLMNMMTTLPFFINHHPSVSLPRILVAQGKSIPDWTYAAWSISGVDSIVQASRTTRFRSCSRSGKTNADRTWTDHSSTGWLTAEQKEWNMRTRRRLW